MTMVRGTLTIKGIITVIGMVTVLGMMTVLFPGMMRAVSQILYWYSYLMFISKILDTQTDTTKSYINKPCIKISQFILLYQNLCFVTHGLTSITYSAV